VRVWFLQLHPTTARSSDKLIVYFACKVPELVLSLCASIQCNVRDFFTAVLKYYLSIEPAHLCTHNFQKHVVSRPLKQRLGAVSVKALRFTPGKEEKEEIRMNEKKVTKKCGRCKNA